MYELFREINEELGTAFIIVTHDRSVAQQTDRILEISDGALLQDVRNQYLAPAARPTASPMASRASCDAPLACVVSSYVDRVVCASPWGARAARRPVVKVAQLAELRVVVPAVAGSNPVLHPNHAMHRPARSAGRSR